MTTQLYRILFIILAGATAACSSTPAAHFYLLSALEDGAPVTPAVNEQQLIGIGPVRLPKYLDRPNIVTRTTQTEMYLSGVHRWAEPLQDNFARVLAENLSRLLGTDKVSIEPSANRLLLDYRVSINVSQFDAGGEGDARLIALWSIHDKDGTALVVAQKSEITLPLSRPATYAGIVDVLSKATGELSREIAVAISGLATAGP